MKKLKSLNLIGNAIIYDSIQPNKIVMKKQILLLLFIPLVFQGCFSYETVKYSQISNDKKQKIIIETVYEENIKGKLIYIDDKQITLKKSGELKSVSKEEIKNVSVRKFSIYKTSEVLIGQFINSKKN